MSYLLSRNIKVQGYDNAHGVRGKPVGCHTFFLEISKVQGYDNAYGVRGKPVGCHTFFLEICSKRISYFSFLFFFSSFLFFLMEMIYGWVVGGGGGGEAKPILLK